LIRTSHRNRTDVIPLEVYFQLYFRVGMNAEFSENTKPSISLRTTLSAYDKSEMRVMGGLLVNVAVMTRLSRVAIYIG
jgi:hypothetical protein